MCCLDGLHKRKKLVQSMKTALFAVLKLRNFYGKSTDTKAELTVVVRVQEHLKQTANTSNKIHNYVSYAPSVGALAGVVHISLKAGEYIKQCCVKVLLHSYTLSAKPLLLKFLLVFILDLSLNSSQ